MGQEEEVRGALKKAFPDSTVSLDTGEDGKVFGTVVSSDFSGMPDRQRQQKLIQLLSKYVRTQVVTTTTLLALTPEEDSFLGEIPLEQD